MKKYILLVCLIIIGSFLGCTKQNNTDEPQSHEKTTEISDNEVSTGAATEISIATIGEQSKEEVLIGNDVHESEITSDESNNEVMETADIDFSKPGVYEIAYNTIYNIDVNMDGTLDSITLNQSGESVEKVSITVNEKFYEFPYHIAALESYIIRKENGDIGMLLCNNGADTCYYTCIYAFNNTELVLKEHVSYGTESLTMNSLTLAGPVNIFGTWDARNNCTLNDGFTLKYSDDGLFKINLDIKRFLATKKDISVQMLEEDDYFDAIIPTNSKIFPTNAGYLDNQGCLVFETEEGLTGRLFADALCVNGISEYDIFDNIIYIGA